MNFQQNIQEFKINYKIAYPIVLGQLGHISVGFIDNIMVGKLGAASLAAVSLANSLLFAAFAIGIGFTLAITPLIAEANGSKNYQNGRKIFIHGILLSLILGILLCSLIFFASPFIKYLDQPKEVLAHLFPYFDILTVSMLPMLLFQAYKQFSDGLSKTKYAMWAAIIASLTNILLNYLLIYGNFGFPQMGLVGAAIGTFISRIIMLVLMMYFIRKKSVFQPFITKIHFKFDKKTVLNFIRLGCPTALQMLFEIGIFTGSILFSGMIGTNAQAANQICLNLSTITFMISMGLSITAIIRVGNYKGKKDFRGLKNAAYSLLLLMILMDILFAIIFITLKDVLPWAYIDNLSVIQIASNLLIISGLFQIPDGIQIVLLGCLRGLQDVKIPMLIIFISYWLIGIPICYFLSLYTNLKTLGIWIGLFISLTITAYFLYIRFKRLTKNIILY